MIFLEEYSFLSVFSRKNSGTASMKMICASSKRARLFIQIRAFSHRDLQNFEWKAKKILSAFHNFFDGI